MKLVNLIEEDFVNYREPGMFLGFPNCSGKCNSPGCTVCQNEDLRHVPERDLIDISVEEIIERYKSNRVSKALICGGLEPFDSFGDLKDLCTKWGETFDIIYPIHLYNPIIIYTGYYPFEIIDKINALSSAMVEYSTIVFVKYGRFIPGHNPHWDPILGVDLASDNQYAESLSETVVKYRFGR